MNRSDAITRRRLLELFGAASLPPAALTSGRAADGDTEKKRRIVARQELPHQAHRRPASVKLAHLHEPVRHSFHYVQLVGIRSGRQALSQRQRVCKTPGIIAGRHDEAGRKRPGHRLERTYTRSVAQPANRRQASLEGNGPSRNRIERGLTRRNSKIFVRTCWTSPQAESRE
jgi:hypothetical protein